MNTFVKKWKCYKKGYFLFFYFMVIEMTNIHESCENYNKSKDYCLKFFEDKVSERYSVCREYSEFSDKELSRKWSN